MRKILVGIVSAAVAVAGVIVTPASAQADQKIPKGYALWTRAQCEAGTRLLSYQFFQKPTGPHVFVYRTKGRVCAFTVDGMKGKHRLGIGMTNKPGNYYRAVDNATYSEYAGAIAAPKGACVWSQGQIVLDGKPYWSRLKRRCG